MVKHDVLLSAKRLVMTLSYPTPNARLVHVEIVDGRARATFQGFVKARDLVDIGRGQPTARCDGIPVCPP